MRLGLMFEEYVRERRRAPIPGFRVEALPDVTRYLPENGEGDGLVMYARFAEREAVERIRSEIGYFAARRLPLEWKVYDLDLPPDLRRLLEAEGLTAHHDEAFLVRSLDEEDPRPVAAPPGVTILRAGQGNAVIDDVVKVQEENWDCAFPGLAAQLRSVGSAQSVIYCAYLDGAPVGTGWVDFTAGSRFADLHGGSVLQGARGRGIYTLLYRRRVEDALARGCRYLAVDAAPMSRPILEHKGFIPVCGTYPMRSAPHAKRGQ